MNSTWLKPFILGVIAGLILVSAGVYVLTNRHERQIDTRTAVEVSRAQKAQVLDVMRDNLVWLTQLMGHLRSKRSGAAWILDAPFDRCPKPLRDVLGPSRPEGWMKIGRALHQECRRMIQDLHQGASAETIFRHVSSISQSCVACHAQYRLDEVRR